MDTPAPTAAPVSIGKVECLADLTVRIHIQIASETGIVSYQVWSTWGGGGDTQRVFTTPLPDHVDEVIEFSHVMVDPEASRIHQFGLSVVMSGVAVPILTYALEPDGRCPGH